MSARVEILSERLAVITAEITAKLGAGQNADELVAEKTQIESDLRRARSLLTEGSEAKVLRG